MSDDPRMFNVDAAPMMPEQITALARDLLTRRAALCYSGDPAFTMMFPVVLMADPTQIPANAVGAWAPMSAAMPRSVNGHPMFFEAHFIVREDVEPLIAEYDRMAEALGLKEKSDDVDPAG